MGKFVLKDCTITVNGVDLSDHASSVEISMEKDDIDTTNFSGGGREHAHGLSNDTITVTFQQDFAAAEVDATLWPLYNDETEFPVAIRATSAAVGVENPEYTATCMMLTYQPLAGSVGDLSEIDVEFQTQRSGVSKAIA